MDLASAEAEIRHVFGDTPITEASIGAAPPDILVKLSGNDIKRKRGFTQAKFGHTHRLAVLRMRNILASAVKIFIKKTTGKTDFLS